MNPSPFDRDALWTKTKSFMNRSFDAVDEDDFSLGAMWAALALELLGKAALAHQNPCLIADPNDDGLSLMIAAGLSEDYARAKTIPAKAVFSRCERAFQPFNAKQAAKIAQARNEELHSAMLPFENVPNEESWWQRYWAQTVILVEAVDEDIAALVGPRRAMVVQKHLDNNAAYVAERTKSLIADALARWNSAQESNEGLVQLNRFLKLHHPRLSAEFSDEVECPACGQDALLVGDEVASSDVEVDPEDGYAWEQLSVYADALDCPHCGLFLDGQPYLEQAELPEDFPAHRDYVPVWEEYMNE